MPPPEPSDGEYRPVAPWLNASVERVRNRDGGLAELLDEDMAFVGAGLVDKGAGRRREDFDSKTVCGAGGV
jgi:hypothetical protein